MDETERWFYGVQCSRCGNFIPVAADAAEGKPGGTYAQSGTVIAVCTSCGRRDAYPARRVVSRRSSLPPRSARSLPTSPSSRAGPAHESQGGSTADQSLVAAVTCDDDAEDGAIAEVRARLIGRHGPGIGDRIDVHSARFGDLDDLVEHLTRSHQLSFRDLGHLLPATKGPIERFVVAIVLAPGVAHPPFDVDGGLRGTAPLLIVNPANDYELAGLARSLSAEGGWTPETLQAELQRTFPKVVVRRRDLSGETTEIWYVYREGRWASSAPPDRTRPREAKIDAGD